MQTYIPLLFRTWVIVIDYSLTYPSGPDEPVLRKVSWVRPTQRAPPPPTGPYALIPTPNVWARSPQYSVVAASASILARPHPAPANVPT